MPYRLVRRIGGKGVSPGQFREALRGVAVDRGRVYAVGDSALAVFTPDGELVAHWATSRPAECVALDGAGRAWVGEWKQVEVFDAARGIGSTFRDTESRGSGGELGI
jgi:hypothetical protein